MPLVQTESVPDSSQPAADATATATRGIRIEEVEEGQSAGAEGGKAWVGVTADQADILERAMEAHVRIRDSCRVTPAEALWVDEAMEAQEQLIFADQGWRIPEHERSQIQNQGGAPTYGELLPAGVDALVHTMGMDEDSVFCDLGCGTGRAMMHLAAAQQIRKAVGIEMSETRLDYGRGALEQLESQAEERGFKISPVEFVCDNIENADLSEVSHLFVSSVCFDDRVLRCVSAKLAASPSFKLLVTLRSIPLQPHLTPLGMLRLANSFHGAHPAFYYVKASNEGLANAPAEALAALLCLDGACWLPPHLHNPPTDLLIAQP